MAIYKFDGKDYQELYEALEIDNRLAEYLEERLELCYIEDRDIGGLIRILKSFLKKLIANAKLEKETERLKADIRVWKAVLGIEGQHAFLDYFICIHEGMWI